jgi:hypothetical protein
MSKMVVDPGSKWELLNDTLWKWSVSEPAQFWEEIWHYTKINAHTPYQHAQNWAGSETLHFQSVS